MPIDDDALGELLDELEIGLELNSAGPAVEPLLDALIGAAPQGTLAQAATEAAEALWDADLEQEVGTELEAFRERAVEENARLLPTIDSALAELGEPARENQVAHALIWRAAAKLARRASRNHERMAELERALERSPQARRRHLTLPIAAAASLAADIGDEEAAKAVAAYAFSVSANRRPSRKQRNRATARLARSLATKERRRAVRAVLAELAELSAEEFPLASLALRELLAEPVPDDPVKDELWVNLVVGLAHEQLEDALGDASVR
ncbi:MAG: hypothetical protein LC777_05210 [Actinobacteria bacterium]|nr:hypothetical protein [Actinomycetota bacterium]